MIDKTKLRNLLKKWGIEEMLSCNNDYGDKVKKEIDTESDMHSLINEICALANISQAEGRSYRNGNQDKCLCIKLRFES